uniref:Uncharacterized protein n=1 Tax=Oryza sativa subsp. japonica TaxID=39947 RepID=Q6K540_ORYSJ|nr:hypothetical protein [Oryza sativa Japonica Group]BAD19764.1 hypothetical protein [Oryza sativa Japonica Group]
MGRMTTVDPRVGRVAAAYPVVGREMAADPTVYRDCVSGGSGGGDGRRAITHPSYSRWRIVFPELVDDGSG